MTSCFTAPYQKSSENDVLVDMTNHGTMVAGVIKTYGALHTHFYVYKVCRKYNMSLKEEIHLVLTDLRGWQLSATTQNKSGLQLTTTHSMTGTEDNCILNPPPHL